MKANRKLAKRLGPESLNVVLIALEDAFITAVRGFRNRDFGTFQKMVCSIYKDKSSCKWLKLTLESKVVAKSC